MSYQKLHDPTLPHDERLNRIGRYLDDLQLHRDSRKGLDGARGEQGLPGKDSVVPGPPGRDCDPNVVAELVKKLLQRGHEEFVEKVESELVLAKATLRSAVIDELRETGLIDSKGQPSENLRGPKGEPGESIRGERGEPGKSIVGPAGKDGRDARDPKVAVGSVTSGDRASVTVREQDGGFYFDFILPKGDTGAASTIPGPRGEQGIPGLMNKEAVAAVVLDMAKRGSLPVIHAANQPAAGISKEDLRQLLAELKPAPVEKKRGFFARLLYGKE